MTTLTHVIQKCGSRSLNVRLNVVIVLFCTMRYEHVGSDVIRDLGHLVEKIIFTGRKAKQKFLFDLGYNVGVWVDDCPHWILTDAKG